MDEICQHHSGVQAELKAICTKIDLRFDDVSRRIENVEKIIIRVGVLEKGMNYREGLRHWSDYLITVIISGAVVFLVKLVSP